MHEKLSPVRGRVGAPTSCENKFLLDVRFSPESEKGSIFTITREFLDWYITTVDSSGLKASLKLALGESE